MDGRQNAGQLAGASPGFDYVGRSALEGSGEGRIPLEIELQPNAKGGSRHS